MQAGQRSPGAGKVPSIQSSTVVVEVAPGSNAEKGMGCRSETRSGKALALVSPRPSE